MGSKLLQFLVPIRFHEIIQMIMINFGRLVVVTLVESSVNIVRNGLT